MEIIRLSKEEFPILSNWNKDHLSKTLENLVMTANPNKTEISVADKLWAATMLEMNLQIQRGIIFGNKREEENLMAAHNRMLLKKLKDVPWMEE